MLLIIALGIFILYKGVMPAWNSVNSDFGNYFVSSRLAWSQQNLDSIYNDTWFRMQAIRQNVPEAVKFSPFPPITAFVMSPLIFFSAKTAQRIWTVINLLFIFPAFWAIKRMTSWKSADCILLILLCGLSLTNNFKFGQLYWALTVVLLCSFCWVGRRKEIYIGSTLGAIASLKYFSIVFIAGFFFQKKFKIVGYALLMILLLFVFQFYFFGKKVMVEYLTLALWPHLNGHLSSQDSFAFEFQSWESLLLNIFVKGSSYFDKPLIDIPLAKDIAKWIVYAVFIFPLLYVFNKYQQYKKENNFDYLVYFALSLLAALALLPASATYHFILLLIPITILLSNANLKRKDRIIIILLFTCIGFIPYRFFFEIGLKWFVVFAYPRLWLITILYFFSANCMIRLLNPSELISTKG